MSIRKIPKVIFSVVLMVCMFTACTTVRELELDVTGYIDALLLSTYDGVHENYIAFSGVTDQEAEYNHEICAENAAFKFFEEHKLNPDEAQIERLKQVFFAAYALAEYSVGEKTETENGYVVNVTYSPFLSISNLSAQVTEIRDNSQLEMFDEGATYIDDIIQLCEDAVNGSVEHGEEEILSVDIILNEEKEYLLNLQLLQTLDSLIMPIA